MKITTCTDVRDQLRAYLSSAALGAALELGLFWKLADRSQSENVIAQNLGIPLMRCRYWLETLIQLGLLEKQGDLYTVSAVGRTTIIDAHSQETWALNDGTIVAESTYGLSRERPVTQERNEIHVSNLLARINENSLLLCSFWCVLADSCGL